MTNLSKNTEEDKSLIESVQFVLASIAVLYTS